MYNLLIVDDEPLITDSLHDLFAGKAGREYNVMRAYSGREALDWIERTRVDILLTDISMPDINGLDVHRHVSGLWPECAVIYLTSFDAFDYIQQAFRNNGEDYILKTEGDGAVVAAVEKAAARLDAKHRERLLLEQARDNLLLALPLLQGKFICDLADGADDAQYDLRRQLENLRLPLHADCPVLLLLGQADGGPVHAATERLKLLYGAKGTMEAYFAGFAVQACAVHEKTRLVMLLQPALQPQEWSDPGLYEAAARNLALRVGGSMDGLQALCLESCGLTLSFAASGCLTAWKDIGAACEALRRKLHDGVGPDGRGLLYFDRGGDAERGCATCAYLELRQQAARLDQMKLCLENGDRDGYFTLYDRAMAAGSAGPAGDDRHAELYYRMASMLMEYVNKWDTASPGGGKPDVGRLVNLEGHASWAAAVEYFRQLSDSLFARQRNRTERHENRIFAFIREYTEKNVGGDLSLTRFAMLLNFHPFYLSRLFKRISGMSLSDYVSGVKLEKAKELLAGGNGRVSDVSAALGFMTPSYFTSFFRKHTGMSPMEYRSLGLGQR